MIRLMYNEVVKLIKKKSFYVVTFIFILFCILTNIVYKTPLEVVETEEISIDELKEENAGFHLDQDDELLMYVENLALIEKEQLKDQYSSNVQEYLIDHFFLLFSLFLYC